MRRFPLLMAAAAMTASAAAHAADKISFQLSWRPQAEHGCFYQAAAAGIYARHGLDVTIVPGGPQINTQQILLAGKVDLAAGSNGFNALNYAQQSLPVVIVAAVFQKDPIGLMTHIGVGLDTLASIAAKQSSVYVSGVAHSTWWPFLRVKYGFKDEQMRPYTFSIAPFLHDPQAVQQAFITNEPYQAGQAGAKVNFFLLADAGFADYAYTIEAPRALIEKKPELVQRFVNASIEGCYSYLYGDPSPANKLILEANPSMTAPNVAYSIQMMRERGLIAGGDAAKLGIGAMTDARWKAFFDSAVEAGLYPADLDYKRGYTLKFVNQRHGMPTN